MKNRFIDLLSLAYIYEAQKTKYMHCTSLTIKHFNIYNHNVVSKCKPDVRLLLHCTFIIFLKYRNNIILAKHEHNHCAMVTFIKCLYGNM